MNLMPIFKLPGQNNLELNFEILDCKRRLFPFLNLDLTEPDKLFSNCPLAAMTLSPGCYIPSTSPHTCSPRVKLAGEKEEVTP